MVGKVMEALGGHQICHLDTSFNKKDIFLPDGIHLAVSGQEIWLHGGLQIWLQLQELQQGLVACQTHFLRLYQHGAVFRDKVTCIPISPIFWDTLKRFWRFTGDMPSSEAVGRPCTGQHSCGILYPVISWYAPQQVGQSSMGSTGWQVSQPVPGSACSMLCQGSYSCCNQYSCSHFQSRRLCVAFLHSWGSGGHLTIPLPLSAGTTRYF